MRQECGIEPTIPRPAPHRPFPALKNQESDPVRVVGSGWLTPLVERLTSPAESIQEAAATEPVPSTTVRVYPSMAAAWQREKRTAEARVWLLLRKMDTQGRGWLNVEDIRDKLTNKASMYRVCGQRRLRAILRAGEGVFWHRNEIGQLWIHGAVQVGVAFDVRRLRGHNVEIEIDALTNGMERFNAVLYSVFHASRTSAPISRATIEKLTGISERSQRDYDHVAKVKRERNFSIEAKRTEENAEDHVWEHNRASFSFTDYKGKQGEAGTTYNARRLPNNYQSPLQRGTNGRKKKINSKLSGNLVTNRAQEQPEEAEKRVFFTDARKALKTANRAENPILRLSGRKDYSVWIPFA